MEWEHNSLISEVPPQGKGYHLLGIRRAPCLGCFRPLLQRLLREPSLTLYETISPVLVPLTYFFIALILFDISCLFIYECVYFPPLKYELREIGNESVLLTAGYPIPKIVSGTQSTLHRYYEGISSLHLSTSKERFNNESDVASTTSYKIEISRHVHGI